MSSELNIQKNSSSSSPLLHTATMGNHQSSISRFFSSSVAVEQQATTLHHNRLSSSLEEKNNGAMIVIVDDSDDDESNHQSVHDDRDDGSTIIKEHISEGLMSSAATSPRGPRGLDSIPIATTDNVDDPTVSTDLSTSKEEKRSVEAATTVQTSSDTSKPAVGECQSTITAAIGNSSTTAEEQNPFLAFAYHDVPPFKTSPIDADDRKRKLSATSWTTHSYAKSKSATADSSDAKAYPSDSTANSRQKHQHNSSERMKKCSTTSKKRKAPPVKMAELDPAEQNRIRHKWHSLIVDPAAPIEVRRFQVLVATRLHARCQEPSVRKAMQTLKEAFGGSMMTVEQVAQADATVLAQHITNLQFYNVKARHICQAAAQIQRDFGGQVPEDEASLLKLTGVGPCFADVLAVVNTREEHERMAKTLTDGSV